MMANGIPKTFKFMFVYKPPFILTGYIEP